MTENTSRILLHIAEAPSLLHKLETLIIDDIPVILVRRSDETEFTSLESLSGGEQSSAILKLAMMNSTNPLLIDQPEEELDYSYVTRSIVRSILDAKPFRQLILISLNPNIPVLGDSEHIIRLQNDPHPTWKRRCFAETAGCFEDKRVIQRLYEMEGGPLAFQRRNHRYTGRQIVG